VDISPESVEIAQLSLWIRTARPGQPLTDLSAHIRYGNSVVDDPTVDPKAAFDWKAQFPSVFERGGFDAVVGNSPYVRQELLSPSKPYFLQHYQAYHGMADLYVYFYERGVQILKPGGRLAFVVTNKWIKAAYAEGLRRFFAEVTWVEHIVDFGHAKKLFKDVDVFPSFIILRKPKAGTRAQRPRYCVIPRNMLCIDKLKSQVTESSQDIDIERLGERPWHLVSEDVLRLQKRLEEAGKPLLDELGRTPLFGIKTGFNKGFYIDAATKEAIVNRDPKSSDLMRPFLRGQDVRRWHSDWNGLWMIAIGSSSDQVWPWSSQGAAAEEAFRNVYPGVYSHLANHKEALSNRTDQGVYWWELRSCAYYSALSKPKIVIQRIAFHPRFSFDASGLYVNDSTIFINTEDLFVLACLNSCILWWYSFARFPHKKDEALAMDMPFVQNLPIPTPRDEIREEVNENVLRLIKICIECQDKTKEVLDWLRIQNGITDPNTKLQNPIALDSDAFANEVQRAQVGKTR
jgi:hypothetical protein